MMREVRTTTLEDAPAVGGLSGAPRRHGWWLQLSQASWFLKLAGGLFILGSWELIVRTLAPGYVAKPSGIIRVLPATIVSREILSGSGTTLWAVTQGLFIALVLGTVVGLAMGHVKVIERLLRVYISGLNAMPMIALLPLLTIWLGFTTAARLATIVFAAFFPVAMNVTDGARSVPTEYLDVARAYGARRHHIWFGVTLPASLPYLLAGIRIAIGRALVGAVVAEFFISVDGLGFYILFQSRTFHHNEAFVAVLMLAAFAIANDVLINWLTKRYLRWYRAGESGNR
jgi:ABC-type nitrate/sulfonate/bicarbonate transport system permease component